MARRPPAHHPWRGRTYDTPPPDSERTCRVCGATKPAGEFRVRNGKPSTRVCKDCLNARSREYRREHPEKVQANRRSYTESGRRKAYMRAYRRRKREWRWDTPPRRWWTARRVSIEIETTENYVRALCRRGKLDAMKAPHGNTIAWHINPASVAAYLQGRGPHHWRDDIKDRMRARIAARHGRAA